MFQTFDKAYAIAEEFHEKYPEDKDWEGVYPNFDEVVIEFTKKHITKI